MTSFQNPALLVSVVAVFGFLNHRFVKPPDAIGITAIGVVVSIAAVVLARFRHAGRRRREDGGRRQIRANIAWDDVVALIGHLGGAVHAERGGSMREFLLNGVRAIFHEPHPGNEVPQAMVRRLRIYLEEAGIENP